MRRKKKHNKTSLKLMPRMNVCVSRVAWPFHTQHCCERAYINILFCCAFVPLCLVHPLPTGWYSILTLSTNAYFFLHFNLFFFLHFFSISISLSLFLILILSHNTSRSFICFFLSSIYIFDGDKNMWLDTWMVESSEAQLILSVFPRSWTIPFL